MKKFATIKPRRVRFKGAVGEHLTETVTIVPEKDYPFTVLGISARKNKHIRYQLKEKNNSGVKTFLLAVENTKKDKGRYFDTIVVKTDSSERPELEIRVYGFISNP